RSPAVIHDRWCEKIGSSRGQRTLAIARWSGATSGRNSAAWTLPATEATSLKSTAGSRTAEAATPKAATSKAASAEATVASHALPAKTATVEAPKARVGEEAGPAHVLHVRLNGATAHDGVDGLLGQERVPFEGHHPHRSLGILGGCVELGNQRFDFFEHLFRAGDDQAVAGV